MAKIATIKNGGGSLHQTATEVFWSSSKGLGEVRSKCPPHNEKKINQQEKQINNKKYSMFAANGYIKMSIRASWKALFQYCNHTSQALHCIRRHKTHNSAHFMAFLCLSSDGILARIKHNVSLRAPLKRAQDVLSTKTIKTTAYQGKNAQNATGESWWSE